MKQACGRAGSRGVGGGALKHACDLGPSNAAACSLTSPGGRDADGHLVDSTTTRCPRQRCDAPRHATHPRRLRNRSSGPPPRDRRSGRGRAATHQERSAGVLLSAPVGYSSTSVGSTSRDFDVWLRTDRSSTSHSMPGSCSHVSTKEAASSSDSHRSRATSTPSRVRRAPRASVSRRNPQVADQSSRALLHADGGCGSSHAVSPGGTGTGQGRRSQPDGPRTPATRTNRRRDHGPYCRARPGFMLRRCFPVQIVVPLDGSEFAARAVPVASGHREGGSWSWAAPDDDPLGRRRHGGPSDYLARVASASRDVEVRHGRHSGPIGRSGDRGRREGGARPHRLHDEPRAGPAAVGVARERR